MTSIAPDSDGQQLLTGQQVQPLLAAVVEHRGGRLLSWRLDHVDANPGVGTTATYLASVEWPQGEHQEMLGCSVRIGGPDERDGDATIFDDGHRRVAVWLYPADPELPGLARAAHPQQMADLVNREHLTDGRITASQITLEMVGYRPRRRAVLKMSVAGKVFYVKVLRPGQLDEVLTRHELLARSIIPAPRVVATTDDHLLITAGLPGDPLARAVFASEEPCRAEDLVDLLDALPSEVARLPRRAPWSDSVEHYAGIVAAGHPREADRLAWLADAITHGLAGSPTGDEPTHGDFHEGQLHVRGGRIVGLLDIDTIGPGRRVDDLACLVAHLSTVQRMDLRQSEAVHQLIRTWVPVFDERVDAVELRLRAAAVIISLATGPFRSQEIGWLGETSTIIDAAEALVLQVS